MPHYDGESLKMPRNLQQVCQNCNQNKVTWVQSKYRTIDVQRYGCELRLLCMSCTRKERAFVKNISYIKSTFRKLKTYEQKCENCKINHIEFVMGYFLDTPISIHFSCINCMEKYKPEVVSKIHFIGYKIPKIYMTK